MRLLTKPPHFDFTQEEEFGNYRYFKMHITERNWVGYKYITKEKCGEFNKKMHQMEEVFGELFEEISSLHSLFFIFDTSVFSDEPSENHKLLDFLEDLQDFNMLEGADVAKIKLSIEYRKKLRYAANSLENFPYLYRWAYLNKSHTFSNEILGFLEKSTYEWSNRVRNATEKKISERSKHLLARIEKKYPDTLNKENEFDVIYDEFFNEISFIIREQTEELIKKIFKYSFAEANLFFFAVYILAKHMMHLQNARPETRLGKTKLQVGDFVGNGAIIYADRPKRDVEIQFCDFEGLHSIENGEEVFLDNILQTQPFTRNVIKKFKTEEDYGVPYSLSSITDVENKTYSHEKIEVLKTIVSWVASRIQKEKIHALPKVNWRYKINDEFFSNMKLSTLHFEENRLVGGPFEEELLVSASAVHTDTRMLAYPVLDPSSWDGLNSNQCALMAYSICLLHDIIMEGNYELKYNGVHYELVFDKEKDEITTVRNTKSRTKSLPKERITKDKTRKEFWVTFHFRRLAPHQTSASEFAKQKAAKYGIKQLPKGFTFVDSHVRGEKPTDPSTMKISALQVLMKTLNKIDTHHQEIDMDSETAYISETS